MEVVKHWCELTALLPLVVPDIPGGQCPFLLLQNMHLVPEQRRPLIQVFLVTKFSCFHPVVTPFQTTLLPPTHDFFRFSCSKKGQELHAETPALASLGLSRVIGIFRAQPVS